MCICHPHRDIIIGITTTTFGKSLSFLYEHYGRVRNLHHTFYIIVFLLLSSRISFIHSFIHSLIIQHRCLPPFPFRTRRWQSEKSRLGHHGRSSSRDVGARLGADVRPGRRCGFAIFERWTTGGRDRRLAQKFCRIIPM